jgi:hypothetical protein
MKTLEGKFKAAVLTAAHGLAAAKSAWGCPTAIFCT